MKPLSRLLPLFVLAGLLSSLSPQPVHAAPSPLVAAVTAYFDMLDFVRTKAWGRPVVTPSAERQRCLKLLAESWSELSPAVRTAIQKLPSAWSRTRSQWATTTAAQRKARVQRWRLQLLLPDQIYPPLAHVATYRSPSGAFSLEYPSGWRRAQAEDEGTQYMFLGDTPAETGWDQVMDPARSPAGALLVITPMTEEIRELGAPLAVARAVARMYVGLGAPGVKEIGVLDGGSNGAIVTLGGKWPGSSVSRFYWVGVVPYGPDFVLAGRLGGPVSQCQALAPALCHIISSLETHPENLGGDEGGLAVSLATSIIGNAVAATNW
jgi:hypothetical protein